MEVILLQDVEKLGLRGDVVDVARGYARNFLLPRRLAENATPARVAELRRTEAERAKHEARTAEQAQEIGKTILRFEVKSGPTGSLFGSVTPSDIADEIWRTRKVRVDRRKIAIDPLKRIGRFTVPIELFQDVHVEVKTLVVPEGGELPPEEELAAIEAAEAEAAAAEAAAVAAAAEEHAAAEAAMSPKSHQRKKSRLPQLPEFRRLRHIVSALAIVGLALVASAAAPASSSTKPRVTVIGDSIMASFEYVPSARRALGRGLDLRSDTAVCRRLVAASCAFQGSTPATALQVIGASGGSLGRVVVINVGYNDWVAVYDVDRVMRALRSAGVHRVIWVTLREASSNASLYAQSNARIRNAARRWKKSLVVADWNAYSHGKSWFREDGLHLTTSGAMGMARLLRPLVVDGSS